MRLIGTVPTEKEAFSLFSYLNNEGIECKYEPGKSEFTIWVTNEDDVEKATTILQEFLARPDDPKYDVVYRAPIAEEPQVEEEEVNLDGDKAVHLETPRKPREKPPMLPITKLVIFICIFLFGMDFLQHQKLAEIFDKKQPAIIVLTKINAGLMYDYPTRYALGAALINTYPGFGKEGQAGLPPKGKQLLRKIQNTPIWQGYYSLMVPSQQTTPATSSPTFGKIREGEFWRLFTPCLLHGGLLHILFNMLWAFYLGKMIEVRAGALRYIFLIILASIVSNTMQYLMSGPLFLGYSGVVAGFAGYIWMRQKIAPWEGYPLQRGTVLFLAIFIVGMALFGFVLFLLQLFGVTKSVIPLANTAHISGALVGMVCARIPLFSRST